MRHNEGTLMMIESVATLQTEKGERFIIRSMHAEDAPLLIDIFEHMSPDSRYRRFNQPLVDPDPSLVHRWAQVLADVESDEGAAWLVFDHTPEGREVPIAGIRYIFTTLGDRREAEIAITVRDDYQNRGIGKALLRYATEQARVSGVERFTALVQAANEPLWAILRHLGLRVEYEYEGPFVQVVVHIHDLNASPQTPP